jgi:hypothetical protein
MKMKILSFAVALVFSMTVVGVAATSIKQTIANINADAGKPGGPAKVLQSISASTHVPVATLEKQKTKTGMTYGDLFIAHSIAKAAGKSFDEIAAQKSKGGDWDKIAADNNVDLGGKKTTAKNQPPANAKPTPTPAQKTLRQIQAERYQ